MYVWYMSELGGVFSGRGGGGVFICYPLGGFKVGDKTLV